MRAVFTIAFLLASLPLYSSSAAEEADERFGTYVGGAFAIGFDQFTDTGGLDFDEAFGLDAWIGLRRNDHLALEFEYVYVDGYEVEDSTADFQGMSYTINAKGYMPFGSLEPYALVGTGLQHLEIDTSAGAAIDYGAVLRFGLGLDFYLHERIALTAGAAYNLTFGDLEDFRSIEARVGIQLWFDRDR